MVMRYQVMRLFLLTTFVLLCGQLASTPVAAEGYKDAAGPHEVETYLDDWHDAERDRDVPVRVYLPVDADGPRPVVLVSHGLGGSREALAYLGEHWASHGYICIHMQHLGSDDAVWRDVPVRRRMRAMRRAAMQPDNAINRAVDTTFVLDQLEAAKEDEGGRLFGRLDLEHIALAGHSFGAWTCLAGADQTFVDWRGRGTTFGDDRIDCIIPLSSPVPRNEDTYERSFASVGIPALHMTGTLDESPITDTGADARRVPYDYTPGQDDGGTPQYLINFVGGDHMVFAGPSDNNNRVMQIMREREGVDTDQDPVIQSFITQSSTAFLDAFLRGDEDARDWLDNEDGFASELGDAGEYEHK